MPIELGYLGLFKQKGAFWRNYTLKEKDVVEVMLTVAAIEAEFDVRGTSIFLFLQIYSFSAKSDSYNNDI